MYLMAKEKEDLTKRIILRDKITLRTGINPLELCLVVGGEYKINKECSKRKRISFSLSYSFE